MTICPRRRFPALCLIQTWTLNECLASASAMYSPAGLREIITYVTVGEEELASTTGSSDSVRLRNPMNAARDRMRTSLRPMGLRTLP